jgi:oligoribonuclease
MQVDNSKWLWVDLEMTGLDPENDRIIEVAAVITDTELNEVASWSAYVAQSDMVLNRMHENVWNEYNPKTGEKTKIGTIYDMHEQSGVLEKIKIDGIEEKSVVKQLSNLIEDNFDGQATLAGNSIHQDRRFIRKWWPDVEKLLHYQMLDVTSFKLVLRAQTGQELEKHKSHAAIDDIRESIEELKYCLDNLS